MTAHQMMSIKYTIGAEKKKEFGRRSPEKKEFGSRSPEKKEFGRRSPEKEKLMRVHLMRKSTTTKMMLLAKKVKVRIVTQNGDEPKGDEVHQMMSINSSIKMDWGH